MANGTWSIIKPQADKNYLTNPSFELGATTPTGWSAGGSPDTLARSTAYTWRGQYSSHVISLSAAYKSVYQNITLTGGNYYSLHVWVYVVSGTVQLVGADYGGVANQVTANSSGTGWQHLQVTKQAVGGGTPGITMYIQSANVAAEWYMDAAQCEDGTAMTTYIDGDQPGCYWTGARGLSTSQRDPQSREGGYPVPLSNYMKFTNPTGMGMLPVNVASMPKGLQGGETYQRTTPLARRMIFPGIISSTSLDGLHAARQALIDLVKPDLVTPQQAFTMMYNDGANGTNLMIKCVYEGGLEGTFDWYAQAGKLESGAQLRVVCHDPYFYSEQQPAQSLGYTQTVTNANYILQRVNGVWSAMGTGANGQINVIIQNPTNGYIYVGGNFSSIGGVTANGVAVWNGGGWAALGSGLGVAGYCLAMVFDAAGNLYVGGVFPDAGGVANTVDIAKWNGSVWSAVGGGVTGPSSVNALVIDGLGNLYAGGAFTQMGAVVTQHIGKWDGSVWSVMGVGGTNGTVYALAVDVSNNIYAGGAFNSANSVAGTLYIAKWNGSVWLSVGGGASTTVRSLIFDAAGVLYAGGEFVVIGGVSAPYIAKWNGTAWAPCSSGTNGAVYAMGYNRFSNFLYLAGAFTTAGGNSFPASLAIWTGSAFIPMDVQLPSSANVYGFCVDARGNIYLGFLQSGSATSATVTVTANTSSKAYPILFITGLTGSPAIYQLMNYTTGRGVWFSNLTIQVGETVALDLRPGHQHMVSTWRGEINNAILQGSRDDDWYLQPGSNNVSCYAIGGTANIFIGWYNTYNSFDGVTL